MGDWRERRLSRPAGWRNVKPAERCREERLLSTPHSITSLQWRLQCSALSSHLVASSQKIRLCSSVVIPLLSANLLISSSCQARQSTSSHYIHDLSKKKVWQKLGEILFTLSVLYTTLISLVPCSTIRRSVCYVLLAAERWLYCELPQFEEMIVGTEFDNSFEFSTGVPARHLRCRVNRKQGSCENIRHPSYHQHRIESAK